MHPRLTLFMSTQTPLHQTSPTTPTTSTTPVERRSSASRRAFLGGGFGALLLAGGASYWGANRYLIDHVEVENVSQVTSTSVTATQAATGTATSTATTYTSDTATITIDKVVTGSGSDTVTYFVADVTIADATILKSAFANDQFGTNIIADPSVIAQQAGAVLAINGDYYGFRDTGIQIRNGVIYRDEPARQGLAFYADGSMRLYDETQTDAQTLLSQGVWQTLSFGPGLVDGGQILSGIEDVEVDTNPGNHSIQGKQPRTGIGWVDTNHLLFIAVDGRSSGYSRGVTMTEMAQIFVDHGAQVAYNLDGGGSTAMVFNGSLVNNPLGKGQERGTSDIVYIAG